MYFGGADDAHISGGVNRILVESNVENNTIAGYCLFGSSDAVTKTAETFLTTGNPRNSTSTAGIIFPGDTRQGTFAVPEDLMGNT